MTESAHGATLAGTVSGFDPEVGLGAIVTPAGDEYSFHCIEIADGSRRIAVGAEVTFDLLAKFGSYEAANIHS